MKSIITFPDRGPWGDFGYRGNCSGHVIKELILHFNPLLFVDVCEGSGTSRDVCREMGLEYVGLDLHRGFDFTDNYVLSRLPRPADMVFSHPPYEGMVDYRNVGKWETPELKTRDLSACESEEEFLQKCHLMLLNQREATRSGGNYATLIGDLRSKGRFRSFQADMISIMPRDELVGVAIKAQHNCQSDNRTYQGRFIPILHEYLLVWERKAATLFLIAFNKAIETKKRSEHVWRNLLRVIIMRLDGKASLSDIYREVEKEAGDLIAVRPHWMEKVRQQLQFHFEHVSRGVWALPKAA